MKITRLGGIAVIALAGTVALAGCSSSDSGSSGTDSATPAAPSAVATIDPSLSGTITAGGSSAQGNAQAAWISAFTQTAKGVTVNYDKSQGSGGGVTNFLQGSYDFAGTDAPLTADQTTQSASLCTTGAIDIPVYLDGVAIIFNIKGVTSLKLSGATIAKIFALKITDWSDPAITTDNGTALPAGPITTVVRSDGSGTTQNFTNYLAATQSSVWTYPAGKTWPVTGNVSAQKGGSGVVSTVAAGSGTIGYADHSAIGSATAVSIIQSGTAIPFSSAAVAKTFSVAAVDAPNGIAGDLSKKFDYTKLTAETYPIPLVSYDVICSTFKSPAQSKLTKAYLSYVTSDLGQRIAEKNAGSAALPSSVLVEAQKSIAAVK